MCTMPKRNDISHCPPFPPSLLPLPDLQPILMSPSPPFQSPARRTRLGGLTQVGRWLFVLSRLLLPSCSMWGAASPPAPRYCCLPARCCPGVCSSDGGPLLDIKNLEDREDAAYGVMAWTAWGSPSFWLVAAVLRLDGGDPP